MNYIKDYDEFNIYSDSVSTEDVFNFIGENFKKNPNIKKEELLEKAISKFEWDMTADEINDIVSEAYRVDHTDILD